MIERTTRPLARRALIEPPNRITVESTTSVASRATLTAPSNCK